MTTSILKKTITGLLSILLFTMQPAHSGIMNADYLSTGDGLLVTDNVNNLEWMDLVQTKGMNRSTALSSFSGFRLASFAEVGDLFSQLFPTFTPNYMTHSYDSGSGDYNGNSVYTNHYTDAENWVSLFGEWNSFRHSYGFVWDSNTNHHLVGARAPSQSGSFITPSLTDSQTEGDAHSGIFLVRDTQTQTPPVDVQEPTTLAILAFSVFGFGIRRFTQNRK